MAAPSRPWPGTWDAIGIRTFYSRGRALMVDQPRREGKLLMSPGPRACAKKTHLPSGERRADVRRPSGVSGGLRYGLPRELAAKRGECRDHLGKDLRICGDHLPAVQIVAIPRQI